MTKLLSQLWFYFAVLIAIGLALVVLYVLRYQPLAQFLVVVTASSLYFLAGVIYHLGKRDLSKNIVLEFLGIAIFVILAFGILTFWRVI